MNIIGMNEAPAMRNPGDVRTDHSATWIGCYGPTGINGIIDQITQALLA
ncbi:hypothetical protein MKY85_07725 [Paenibacillus sp. FSL R5-0749]